ncbi:Ni/Fe hydrogenase subunit alpha [Dehalococcoidia bacterium]|nr:Ni/Fe hydrogenase subunit alpha [Dehalococcoidia bacterium]
MSRKITIEPVTRIEGHARVTIHVNGTGEVENAYLHVDQFRGFEKFCEGRMFFEMPVITPRICGICPVSHHLASAKACDMIAGVTPPRPALLLRELMHMGQMVQSHSMHFFHLAGPDLIFGFDADPAIRNVVGIIEANPELALKAVRLRKYGQEVIRIVAGRRIHARFAVPGGVNKALTEKERDELLAPIDEMIGYMREGLALAKQWLEANQDVVQRFANFSSGYMGLVDPESGALELYDGPVRLIDRDGKLLEQFDGACYLDYIREHVEDWSYLKFPYYKKMGWPAGVYRVAPLGRLNVADCISTPLASEEFKKFKAISKGPVEPSLYMHYARLIEDIYAAERIRELLEDPDILSTDIITESNVITGEGVGVIEAPRGTLFHHYWTDENGQITRVNLIVATGHNNWAMSRSVELVAKEFVDVNNPTEGMLNQVEAAIRAYDPCLSCSTHAIGQMPLVLEVRGPDGELINRLLRGNG